MSHLRHWGYKSKSGLIAHSGSSQSEQQEKSQSTLAAPDLAILLVHTGQSSSLIGQNAEADTVPARLPEMKYREELSSN